MKIQKSILFILITLMSLSFIIALTGVTQTDIFYDGSTSNPVTNVQEIIYTCSNSNCSSQGTLVHNLNTGNSNSITFEYPYNRYSTENNPDYYSHFSFASCYLPKEYKEWVWGSEASVEYDYHMNKVKDCRSPIDSFSVTNDNYVNEPVIVNMAATLKADAHSAFTDLQLKWFPAGYEDYYSVETLVTLEIINKNTGKVVNTQTKNLNILMDTFENVQFSWTPTEKGEYTARIKTDVTDCQCSSSIEQFSEKQFTVWEERPRNECYTILNDLVASPQFAKQGEKVEITFTKISNYAGIDYSKTAINTKINLEIRNSANAIVYSDNKIISANSDILNPKIITFYWTPTTAGSYNIKVTGVGESNLCDGKTNPIEVLILGFIVNEAEPPVVPEKYDVNFIVKDSKTNEFLENAKVDFGVLNGLTDSNGKVGFEVEEGNYDWKVSMTGYVDKAGTTTINKDTIINVAMVENLTDTTSVKLIYPNGGETLKGVVEVLWSAVNSLGHEFVIDIDYSENGFNWINIVSDVDNDGSYFWNTKNIDNDEYFLRICAEDQTTKVITCDVSDGSLKIKNEKDDDDDDDKKYIKERGIKQEIFLDDLFDFYNPYSTKKIGVDEEIDLGIAEEDENWKTLIGKILPLLFIFGIIIILILIIFLLLRK